MRLSTAQAMHEAEQRESQQAHKNSQQAHKKVEMALRQRNKELKEKLKDETTEWSLYTNRLEKQHVDAKRHPVAELRGVYVITCRSISAGKGPVERPQCSGGAATSSSSSSIACATAGAACLLRRWIALSTSCGS